MERGLPSGPPREYDPAEKQFFKIIIGGKAVADATMYYVLAQWRLSDENVHF